MIKKLHILTFAAAMGCLLACVKETYPSQPDWSQFPNPEETTDDDGLRKPLEATNNIVAHRGGSSEAKCPDNSMASLRYAISLGCYASECDIYWTKDNDVIVAHANGECKINGLHPWEATLAEIRAAGTLSNGEQIPSLSEFIDVVMKEGSCTRLWLDIKNITSPSTLTQYPINAVKRSCEIISEKGANHFVEFICTSNSTVMNQAFAYATLAGINIGWMANQSAQTYQSKTYKWANLSAASMDKTWGGSGARTLEEFETAGIPLSIFNVDMQAGDGNAVYDADAVKKYVGNASRFKALCTNYPQWLIAQVTEVANMPHCVDSADEFKDFVAALNAGTDIVRWTDASGVVTLSADIDASALTTPIAEIPADLVIDGKDHKIYNINMGGSGATGFIVNNKGTLKNLIFGSSNGTSYDGKSVISTTDTPTHIGLIAQSSGRVENVKNFAKVVCSAAPSVKQTGLGGIVGLVSGGVVDSCENYGEVVLDETVVLAEEIRIGGVIGRVDSGSADVKVTISKCINRADLTMTAKVAKVMMMGGVIGVAQNGASVIDCQNMNPVSYRQAVAPGNWMAIGGVAGALYTNASMKSCVNNGKVYSDLAQVVRIGGISAVVNSGGTVEGCVNNADVTLAQPKNANWQAAGGIVGFEEKGTETAPVIIKSNTNNAAVTVTVDNAATHVNKVALGGIIGTSCSVVQLTGNINKGAVTGTNAGTVGVYAGGITGWYIKGTSYTASGNENSGAVKVTASSGFAGGVIGSANVAAVKISSDKSNADITANTAGALAGENKGVLENCSAGGTVNGAAVSASNLVGTGSGSHTGDIIL